MKLFVYALMQAAAENVPASICAKLLGRLNSCCTWYAAVNIGSAFFVADADATTGMPVCHTR